MTDIEELRLTGISTAMQRRRNRLFHRLQGRRANRQNELARALETAAEPTSQALDEMIDRLNHGIAAERRALDALINRMTSRILR